MMHRRPLLCTTQSPKKRTVMRRVIGGLALCLPLLANVLISSEATAQADTRVMWEIDYDQSLTKAQREEISASMMRVLARAKERHFASDRIIEQKLKTEGLVLPACFEDGTPCSAGGAFLLDVYNVDALAHASFSRQNDNWSVDLKLYQRLSASAVDIQKTDNKIDDLIHGVVSALFEMESGIEVTSTLPGVQVFLNNNLVGIAPISIKTAVGDQRVSFKKDGYVSDTWVFSAEKGKIHQHEADLKPEMTHLTVLTSDPLAEIWVDDALWAKSNETQKILPGDHKIEVKSLTHNGYEQSLKVYPGNPQTIHAALLPISESPYTVRNRGIKRYRFSATAGYHFGLQSFSLSQGSATLDGKTVYPQSTKNWADTSFHGLTMAFNYEAEYWGLTLLRLDFMGSAVSSQFELSDRASTAYTTVGQADGATLITLYPAQFKAHYTFWVMQVEAVLGVGMSYLKLDAKHIGDGPNFEKSKLSFSRTALSLNLDVALKYFFTEETFAMVSYGLQNDFEKRSSRQSSPRHGLTLAVGMQIPMAMRDKVVPIAYDLELEDGESEPNETVESAQDKSRLRSAEQAQEPASADVLPEADPNAYPQTDETSGQEWGNPNPVQAQEQYPNPAAPQYPAPNPAAPQYPAPNPAAPQYPAPNPAAPQYPAPQYPNPAAPQYPAPQYPNPAAPQYPAPQYPNPAAPQYPAPQYPNPNVQGQPAAPADPYQGYPTKQPDARKLSPNQAPAPNGQVQPAAPADPYQGYPTKQPDARRLSPNQAPAPNGQVQPAAPADPYQGYPTKQPDARKLSPNQAPAPNGQAQPLAPADPYQGYPTKQPGASLIVPSTPYGGVSTLPILPFTKRLA